MGEFQLTIDIDRPLTEVFGFIAEPRNMPKWYDAVDNVTPTTEGPTGLGARYRVTRSLPSGQAHNDVEITDHEINRSITLESRDGPTPFRYRYDIRPSQRGTLLTLDGRITSTGLPGPLAELDGIATHLFKRGMRQNLTTLKRIIEAS